MLFYNHRTRITASLMGVLLASAGILNHGIFEILQGYRSTEGFFIEAIGESHRFWIHGTEGAFTIIHNFLITGIFVVLIGFLIIIWSIKYMHSKHGASVFLILFILLTLTGGGIGHVILFIPVWAYATRINRSLDWWKVLLPEKLRKTISKFWIYGLILTSLSWLTVMELGIFGFFPGINNPDEILNAVFIFLLATVILTNITFVCGIACDIEERELDINQLNY